MEKSEKISNMTSDMKQDRRWHWKNPSLTSKFNDDRSLHKTWTNWSKIIKPTTNKTNTSDDNGVGTAPTLQGWIFLIPSLGETSFVLNAAITDWRSQQMLVSAGTLRTWWVMDDGDWRDMRIMNGKWETVYLFQS